MATSSLNLRAYRLLGQLQAQCFQSRQLLIAHRYASTQSKPIASRAKPSAAAAAATTSSRPAAHPSGRLSPNSPSSSSPATADSPNNTSSSPPPPLTSSASSPSPAARKPEEFVPEPLDRPLGVAERPQAGENTGVDGRTLRQRRDDLVDYDKHLARRRAMTAQIARPYYRDWKNMRQQEGKLWLAPERLLRAERALYMPNLHGTTLDTPFDGRDTTAVLEDRVSVVRVFSGDWAMRQADSFVRDNADLQRMLEEGRQARNPLQNVQVNVEQNALKSWLIRLFLGRIRRSVPEVEHENYFMVTKGLTGQLKEQIGMLNAAVGFVYLVDHECKIRWAGSANAEPEERVSLARGAARLVQEYRKRLGEAHWAEHGFDPNAFIKP